jgi:RING finger protein 113A
VSAREIVPQQYAGDATYESQIDTATDRDARAILERNLQANADGSAEDASGKVYKGQAGYKNYITKNEAQVGMNKYTGYVRTG